ncbi:DNA-binding protein [Sessilibacter corallicola]|uniref:DNA-binding protein n=1 Tax=Sessilibacter corallicola TaxID=2904075 RepID=A0ABQ0AF82_9GAMM
MARGGINKALVIEARDTLLNRGENPSIDAIRVELGNTGSKSTIHRYLKEIEEESSARLDDEALLSEPIKALISKLTATLRQEAHSIVESNKEQNQHREQALKARITELEGIVASQEKTLNTKEEALQEKLVELGERKSLEGRLSSELAEAKQAITEQNAIVTEKQSHIDSLEEKHRHNRDAMEHYRQSVKEQREQDQRNHEQQLHQLQAEIRALNQTLSVKQNDITGLNKDNGRLVAEISAAQKTLAELQAESRKNHAQIDAQASENNVLKNEIKKNESHISELELLRKKHKALTEWKEKSLLAQAKLEAEVAVKNELVERLLKEKSKNFGGPVGKECGSPDCEYD